MDLTTALRKLRKSIASFSVVAIIASLSVVSAVSAASYKDVPADAWYAASVNELVDAGVIDGTKDMFHPGMNLNRAEAAKMAVLAAGVPEEDLVKKDKSSFSDVPLSAWYSPYVETAKELGYIKGDDGKTTFRPEGNLNRAEASKILGLALELDPSTAGAPHFKDVKSADWFYGSVETAYHWSVVNGYDGGVFKPGAFILRSEMAKMTVGAMNPVERDESTPTPAPGVDCTKTPTDPSCVAPTPTPVAGGDMSVALASDTPAATTHASGTAYNNALKFNVTASASKDAKITGITVTRGGISVDSNLSGVAVFDAAGVRHGNFLTFSENKAMITFNGDPIVVKAGQTSALWVKTNVSGTSGTYNVAIASAADVITDGGKVTGSFPVTGSTFQLANGGAIVGTLTVDAVLVHNNGTNDATAVNINLGTKDQDIGKFRFAAGANEDVKINQITMYNNGNANDGDVQNIRLVAPDGTILSTVAQTKDRNAIFDLGASPYVIAKGNTRDLTVRVDVVSGSTRTARFVIQNDYDIQVTGASTLSGLLATAAGTVDAAFPMGDSSGAASSCTAGVTCINKITVNSGTLLFSKSNTSPTGNVAAGGTNLTIGSWDITPQGEDMELRTVSAVLTYSTVPTGSFKIKVGDATVYSSSTFAASPATQAVTLSSYPILKSGVKTTISYVIDVGSSTSAGSTYAVSMDLTQVKRLSTNDLVDPGVAVTSANTLSVATASMSASKNSAFNDTTLVAGLTNGKIGSFNLNASSTEDVTVSSVTVGLTNTTNVSNLKLMVGATQLGQSITTPVASNVFSISGFKITKGTTATVDVYMTTTSSASGTEITSLTALGASGAASSVTITATGLTVTGQTITFAVAGTLTVALDTTNTPVSKIVHSGMVDETVLATRLTSSNAEDINITNIQVTGVNADNNFKDLKLFVGAVQVGATTQVVKGVAAFSGLSLVIAKDSTVTLLVKASTTTSGIINSTSSANFAIGYIEATGVSGGATIKPGSSAVTMWTAGNLGATAGNLTVGSTVGFHAGDVVVAVDKTNGGGFGLVMAEPTATTTLSVAGVTTANSAADSTAGMVAKFTTGATTTSSAGTATGTDESVATAFVVVSTKGFAAGDVVILGGGTSTQLGYVTTVASSTSMSIRSSSGTNVTAVTRISKLGTDTLMTTVGAATNTPLTRAGKAITVASTSGFNVGDFVLVSTNVNGVPGTTGIVTAVASTTLTIQSDVASTAFTTAATIERIGAINPSTALVTSTASVDTPIKSTGTAITTNSTTGFGIGDVVVTASPTRGAVLGVVGGAAVTTAAVSSTQVTVRSAADASDAATRISRLPGAASNGAMVLMEDTELTITPNSTFTGGSTAGGSGQTVGMFDFKADGDRNMDVSQVRVKMGGSNVPTAFVHNFDLYNGTSLLSSGTNTIGALAADDNTETLTVGASTIKLCAVANDAGNGTLEFPVSAAGVTTAAANKIKSGDVIVFFVSATQYATYTLTADPTAGTCTAGGASTDLAVTSGSFVGAAIVDNDAATIYNYTVTFGSSSNTSSPTLATQTITAGSTMTLSVKADTTSVKSGVTSGTTNFNVKLDGVAGPVANTTNSVTWTYTPSGTGVTPGSLTISDSYPVAAPTLVF